MPRYERGDEFWEVSRDGTTITIKTGKVGTDGMTTVEQLASPAIASTRWNVIQNQQVRAGWKLHKPPVEAPVVEKPLPQAPEVFDARNPELERAISENPEDASLFEVYGDWLQAQGDPRGKLIALEVAARDKPYGDKHHAAVARCVQNHLAYLRGGFDNAYGQSVLLHHGFIASISLEAGRLADRLAKMFAFPGCRFVTRLKLDVEFSEGEEEEAAQDLADALGVIAKSAPPTLRHLEIGGDTYLRSLDVLAKRLPKLRTFGLTNINDRELDVAPGCLKLIARSAWPNLEVLKLEVLRGSCTAEHIAPLFDRDDLPKLVELQLRTRFDDDLVARLVTSPLAGQLERLTIVEPGGDYLAGSHQGDALGAVLLDHRARLPRLRELDIPYVRFSPEMVKRLTVFGAVHDADGEDRYQNTVE